MRKVDSRAVWIFTLSPFSSRILGIVVGLVVLHDF